MTKNCLNCNNEIQGNFCSNCGQSTKLHKINLHYLVHDIQHGLLHFDNGILFTVKELFIRPGNSIREFLNGKRANHFKPFSLVIILSGIYALLSYFFHIDLFSNNYEMRGYGQGFNNFKTSVDELREWFAHHFFVISLLQIPVFSIGTYVMFKKEGYNYIEHLVINSFITGQKLFLYIVTLPICYWLIRTNYLNSFNKFIDFIGYILAFFTIFQLFSGLKFLIRFWKTLLSLIIPLLIFIAIFLIILIVVVYYYK